MIILPDGNDIVDVVAGEPSPKRIQSCFENIVHDFIQIKNLKEMLAYIGEDLMALLIENMNNRFWAMQRY